ncbi:MAG: hypothetical protein IPI49_05240 [Myxococcales bacterium]|nr:hypothetical protein [Myxococcales bacterium]
MSTLKFGIKLNASPSHDQRLTVDIDGRATRLSPAIVAAMVAGAQGELSYDAEGDMLLASYSLRTARDEDVLRFLGERGGGSPATVSEARRLLAEAAAGNTF